MLRRVVLFLLLTALIASSALASNLGKERMRNFPVRNGQEDLSNLVISETRPMARTTDEVGTIYQAGTTWYDYQHNGSSGKMITVDSLGFIQMVWMNGLASSQNPRHIYYNVWDPGLSDFTVPGGSQVNSSSRGGYSTVATRNDGFSFPAFHEVRTGDPNPHSSVAIDFLPHSGAFTTFQPAYIYENNISIQTIWPKIAIDRHGTLHVTATESPASGVAGDPQRIYYSRGIPSYDGDGFGLAIDWEVVSGAADEYLQMDRVMVIAPDIACSKISDRVAMAWSHSRDDLEGTPSQYNNDLYLAVSEDGGVTWGEAINITNFIAPDLDCASGDTAICNRDTFRVYTDCNIIFDQNDDIHVAFTTSHYYELEGFINTYFSQIWHWGENTEEYSPIAYAEYDSVAWGQAPGGWQRAIQRPNLSCDWNTGFLYCSYWRYMADQASSLGYASADAFIGVSCNGGRVWSEGTNVTDTDCGPSAPEGQSMCERDMTLADHVSYENGEGFIHLSYVFDRESGAVVQETETPATLNPVNYQRISVNDIPLRPLHNPYYPVLHYDSTGIPGSNAAIGPLDTSQAGLCTPTSIENPREGSVPGSFALYQNYPNPFNPNTNIQFDMSRAGIVNLKVYNVLGQEVVSVVNNKPMVAGAHTVEFDGTNLSSGVYLYKLEIEGFSATRKMVLMK